MNTKEAGKIYILRNSSLAETLVKIGRTKRLSESRAREISTGTGVPLEYEVLYEEDVLDCVLAEKLIHKYLHEKRINPNREFFKLPLKEAVKVVFKICLRVNGSIKKKVAARVALFINVTSISKADFNKLKEILCIHKGKSPVYLTLDTKNYKQVSILVGEDLFVKFSASLVNEIRNISGIKSIDVHSQQINEDGKMLEENVNLGWD